MFTPNVICFLFYKYAKQLWLIKVFNFPFHTLKLPTLIHLEDNRFLITSQDAKCVVKLYYFFVPFNVLSCCNLSFKHDLLNTSINIIQLYIFIEE